MHSHPLSLSYLDEGSGYLALAIGYSRLAALSANALQTLRRSRTRSTRR